MRQTTIGRTICKTGYTSRIRPPTSYTDPLKLVSMKAYGLGTDTSAYEFDHLISLKLGGAPSDIRNLWPESHHSPSFSYRKDGLENSLNAKVCNRTISLATAQRRIVNWTRFVSTSGGGQTTPATTPTQTTMTPRPTGQTKYCFSAPSACGYPDPTNTGVPAGTKLTASGSITASTAGQTISARDVTGKINVTANNVTIQNTRVTQTGTCGTVNTCGNSAIQINEGVSGTVIRNVETRTVFGDTCEQDIRDQSEGLVTIEDSYLHACDSNLIDYGNVRMVDTFGLSKIDISSDHVENIYFADSTLSVVHSTLFNPVEQTAVIFGDVNGGSGGTCQNHLTVETSLLAGGGYTLYPCGNGTSAGSSTWSVTNTHFARCLTATHEVSGGHWVCTGGPDSNGYYPESGSYGLDASSFASGETWQGNVWDDNLATIPAP